MNTTRTVGFTAKGGRVSPRPDRRVLGRLSRWGWASFLSCVAGFLLKRGWAGPRQAGCRDPGGEGASEQPDQSVAPDRADHPNGRVCI